MIDLFKEKIKTLLPSEAPVLAAVSGGVDSVVLVHLLALSNIPFAIAHCNFSLRGDESEEDASFVEDLSNHYKVPFHTIRFDTLEIAKNEKVSIQMAARKIRYDWFEKISREYNYACIATAHHKNDVIETVLLNMTRGTGLKGYHGIREKSNNLIRPLLSFDKESIVFFANRHHLKFREDSSNNSEKYSRNLIRKKVVPVLKEINPSIEDTFSENTHRISLAEAFLNEKIEELKPSLVTQEGENIFISIKPIIEKPYFHFILFEVIKHYGFSWQQCLDIDQKKLQSGKKLIADRYVATIDRQQIIIQPTVLQSQQEEILNSIGNTDFGMYSFSTEFVENSKVDLTEADVAYLNGDLLKIPLTIRTWKDGDIFYPLGMRGSKKLSDFFIDNKIPIHLKAEVPIITSGTDIVWITGIRIDNRYRWQKTSAKAYKISFKRKINL